MKTAYLVRDIPTRPDGPSQKLYRLGDLDLSDSGFVVVSAVIPLYGGPETYIFPADEDGNITSWGELNGSFRGSLDHEKALRNAGYQITDQESRCVTPTKPKEPPRIVEPDFVVDFEPEDP